MLRKMLSYNTLGLILLIAYLGQEVIDFRWQFLLEQQADEMFKRWSGVALSIFILMQWSLTIVKLKKRWSDYADLFGDVHKWMGALSPLAFYVHAMEFGYAYLFFLSVCFFSNFAIGLLNTDNIKTKANWYIQGWMITHVALSTLITLLILFHIWIVFSYE